MWKFFPKNIQICIFKVKFQSKNSAIKSNLSLKFHIFFETIHYLERIVAPVNVENFCNSVECWCVQLVNLVNTCGHLVSRRCMVKVTPYPPTPPTPNRGPAASSRCEGVEMWRWDWGQWRGRARVGELNRADAHANLQTWTLFLK